MSLGQFYTSISTTSGGRTFTMSSGLAERLMGDVNAFTSVVQQSAKSEFRPEDREFSIAGAIYSRAVSALSSVPSGNPMSLSSDTRELLEATTRVLGAELVQAKLGNQGGSTTRVMNVVSMLGNEILQPGIADRQAQLAAANVRTNAALNAPATNSVLSPASNTAGGSGDVMELLFRAGAATTSAEKGSLLSRAIDGMVARLNAAPSAPTPPSAPPAPTLISAPGAVAPGGAAPQVPPAPVMRTLQGGELMDAIRGANIGDMVSSRNGAFGLGRDGEISQSEKLRFTIPAGTTNKLSFDFGSLKGGEQVTVDFFGDNGKLLGSRSVNGTDSGNATLSVDDLGAIKSAEIRRGNSRSAFTLTKASFETTPPPAPTPGATNPDMMAGMDPARFSGLIDTVGRINRVVTGSGSLTEAQKLPIQSQASNFLTILSTAMQGWSAFGSRVSNDEFSRSLGALNPLLTLVAGSDLPEDEKNPLLDSLGSQMRQLFA